MTGAFKPAGSGFYAPVMKNNSTLDLSGWDPAGTLGWPVYSRSTAGNAQLSFANNANITVKVSGRTDLGNLIDTYLLKWGTGAGQRTTRPQNAVFSIDDDAHARGYYLEEDETGLKLKWYRGLVIRIVSL